MSADPPFAARVVRCPACGGEARYAIDNPARPFCSPRCKNNDFGAWASESFALAARPRDEDDDAGVDGSPAVPAHSQRDSQ